MSEIDDGIIKFDQSDFVTTQALELHEYRELESWRKKLYQYELIGEYLPSHIGYGNISQRRNYSSFHSGARVQFVISGTQTGGRPDLDGNTYTRVVSHNLKENKIAVRGPIQASSESLTHAAIYEIDEKIQAVFHIHDRVIWEGMLKDNSPKTAKETPYGTVEMAKEVQNLFPKQNHGLFAMAGHEEGVVAFAESLDEAGEMILNAYHHYKTNC